jgi:hypothetical protein
LVRSEEWTQGARPLHGRYIQMQSRRQRKQVNHQPSARTACGGGAHLRMLPTRRPGFRTRCGGFVPSPLPPPTTHAHRERRSTNRQRRRQRRVSTLQGRVESDSAPAAAGNLSGAFAVLVALTGSPPSLRSCGRPGAGVGRCWCVAAPHAGSLKKQTLVVSSKIVN